MLRLLSAFFRPIRPNNPLEQPIKFEPYQRPLAVVVPVVQFDCSFDGNGAASDTLHTRSKLRSRNPFERDCGMGCVVRALHLQLQSRSCLRTSTRVENHAWGGKRTAAEENIFVFVALQHTLQRRTARLQTHSLGRSFTLAAILFPFRRTRRASEGNKANSRRMRQRTDYIFSHSLPLCV